MDNNKYTSEEEMYRRMLDQEVPDLWNRIEEGLDRKEQGNVISFENAPRKRSPEKRRQTRMIIGAVAAAVVMIVSALAFGLSQRESRKDSSAPAASDTEMNQAVAEERVDEADQFAMSNAASADKRKKSEAARADVEAEASAEPQAGDEAVAAAEEAADASAEESKQPESEQTAPQKDASDSQLNIDGNGKGESYTSNTIQDPTLISGTTIDQIEELLETVQPGTVQAETLGELADLDSPESIVLIYRMVDGKAVSYRIFTRDATDQVQLLEAELYKSDEKEEKKAEQAITFKEDTRLEIREDILPGQKVFFLP